MLQSQLFTKTLKLAPADEPSANAQLLTRGGFVYKNSAGIYTFLPLGWRVIEKICNIIRDEMRAIGGVELFMPALVDKKYLEATGRWGIGIGYKVSTSNSQLVTPNFVLGWTHEEVITAIAAKYVNSYKDLPFAVYQIQTKFRAEPRAKSGLLRGREFLMKDLYSFHTAEKDLFSYYDKVKKAYLRVFKRCGLKDIYYTLAGGGDFTMQNTHEFQVLASVGEDTIFYCKKCKYAENAEISKLATGSRCPQCKGEVDKSNAIEVGNIFPLGTKYSDAFGLRYSDKNGQKHSVVMGSYGIGISRLMAAIVEIYHDEKGIVWPSSVAPFVAHLIEIRNPKSSSRIKTSFGAGRNSKERAAATKLYSDLQKQGIEVLYDDRMDKTPGEKFADADLIGIPYRIVVSEKTLQAGSVEVKQRSAEGVKLVKTGRLPQFLNAKFKMQDAK